MSQQLSWNALFLSGSVVSLSTSMWRARAKIRAEDLGIDNTSEVQAALSLGNHRLAPAKAFEDILKPAREASRVIDFYSVNFGLIKGARYVPEANLPKLLAELNRLKIEFYDATQAFMDNFEPTRAAMLPVIGQALKDATKDWVAAEKAFQRIQAEYPSALEVRGKFSLGWSVYAIRSPKTADAGAFAEQETQEVKSIVADMVKQLRGEMTEKLQDILSITAKGGKLQGKSLESANQMLDRLETLNILGDTVLVDQIRAMRSVLSSVDTEKVAGANYDATLVTGLNDIQKVLETSVEEAIANAERTLTGVGRRKLSLAPEAEEMPADAAPVTADYAEAGL